MQVAAEYDAAMHAAYVGSPHTGEGKMVSPFMMVQMETNETRETTETNESTPKDKSIMNIEWGSIESN